MTDDRLVVTQKPKANGAVAPASTPLASTGEDHAAWTFPGHRPFVSGRFAMTKLLEVELAKADAELAYVRATQAALKQREEELIDMRDTALYGIGILGKKVHVTGGEEAAHDADD